MNSQTPKLSICNQYSPGKKKKNTHFMTSLVDDIFAKQHFTGMNV